MFSPDSAARGGTGARRFRPSRAFGRLGTILRRLRGNRAASLPDNVNLDKRFIAIHIPKTGGSSVGAALGIASSSHWTAADYKRALGDDFSSFFRFAFARNPWDRFLSNYHYARMEESLFHSAASPEKARGGKHGDYDLLRTASLRDCARLLVDGKLGTAPTTTKAHWRPQHEWILDPQGNPIVDFVGRLESIQADFQTVAARLGIPVGLPRLNRSVPWRNSYQEAFDAETRALVGRFYARDAELFGYEF